VAKKVDIVSWVAAKRWVLEALLLLLVLLKMRLLV
jgi:hypothetical protein